MKRILKVTTPLVILVAAVAIFVYMKNTKPKQMPVEIKEKVWMIHANTIALENLPAIQTLYGVIESNALVQAAAPVSAVVEKVAVLPGDEVKKGQLLVALSEQDLALPVVQAQADLADAKAQLALQKMTMKANEERLLHEQKVLRLKQEALQRTKALIAKNLASQSAVDAANEALVKQEYALVGAQLQVEQGASQHDQLRARLEKNQVALELAQLNQQRGVVKAPFDARVSDVKVSVGDRVNAGSVLVSFYGLESLEFKAKLPNSSLQQAQKALSAGKVLQAQVAVAESSKPMESSEPLRLQRLAGEAATSGVEAYFSLPESLHSKRPGELMEVYFEGLAYDQVAVVPYSAIYGNNRIYLIEDGRLQSLEITLKGEVMRNGKLMALVQSEQLASGNKVLVTHLPNAMNGLKVAEVE